MLRHLQSSLFPWKHGKTKAMAAERSRTTPDEEQLVVVHQELFPCEVCGRTFASQPLQKHRRVCEKNAAKKRRKFDSLKQRVEGTDLAPFHQKSYIKKQDNATLATALATSAQVEVKTKRSKWKEKHLALVQAIRAAKGGATSSSAGVMSAKRSTSSLAPSASANERCPSCDRHFGPKAFDRHVEWCKERKSRIQKSPASVLIAKERLEARIKYKVPPLKPRRALTREKYASPEGSVKSASNVSLERGSPRGVRKPRSVADVGKKDVKKGVKDRSPPPTQREGKKKEKDAVAEQPAKSYANKRKPVPHQLKLNKVAVNDEVQGMTVCRLTVDETSEEEEKKMITWKDTLTQKKNVTPIQQVVKETEVKERKKEKKKLEKPVVTEEFLEDLKISKNLLKGPRSKTKILLAKYKINEEPNSARDLLSENQDFRSKTHIAVLKRTSKLPTKKLVTTDKGKKEVLKSEEEPPVSPTDLIDDVQEIKICSKCSEEDLVEKHSDDEVVSPNENQQGMEELELAEVHDSSSVDDEFVPQTPRRCRETYLTKNLENCLIDDEFDPLVTEKMKELDFAEATGSAHDDSVSLSARDSMEDEEEFTSREPMNENLPQEFAPFTPRDTDTDFDPTVDLLEPPPFFQNEPEEPKDTKTQLIEKLIDALDDEDYRNLQLAAGDQGQTYSGNFDKFLDVYQRILEEKSDAEKPDCHPSKEMEGMVSSPERNLEATVSKETIVSDEGDNRLVPPRESSRNESVSSMISDDYSRHLEDGKSLLTPRADVEPVRKPSSCQDDDQSKLSSKSEINETTRKYNSEVTIASDDFKPQSHFEARTEFHLPTTFSQERTNTILEPRDWDLDDLESLTGNASKWTEALSMERLNKGSIKSSHSDVGLVYGYEPAPAKKLVVNIPSVFDRRESLSAPPVVVVSSSEGVPEKKRRVELDDVDYCHFIEGTLSKNIDMIRKQKREEEEGAARKLQEAAAKKKKKKTNCGCDVEVTPRFRQLLNFLAINTESNAEEVLTVSRRHCMKLLNFDGKDSKDGSVKLPQICVREIKNKEVVKKSEDVRLPPLNLKGTREYRTVVNPLMVVGQNFNNSDETIDGDYNPFVTAERQLMELLQCDDFTPFTPQSITRPHTTDTTTKPSTINNNKPIKSANSAKRSSVIDPPSQFEDKLTALNDNFELIESFINDNFTSFSSNNEKNLMFNRRKYSDDLSSIDPKLINANDDLSIPDNFNLSDTDPYSLQYDKNLSAFEPIVPKAEIIDDLKRSVSLIRQNETAVDFGGARKPKTVARVNSFRQKTSPMSKSANSGSSGAAGRGSAGSGDKKKVVGMMKRSVSLAGPVGKPRNFRNREEVHEYFNGREKSGRSDGVSPEKESSLSPTSPKTAANPFTIDDEMFEEYRKYEEMYLQEKQQKLKNQHKASDVISNEDDDGPMNNKINSDSAYSSLKTSKVRARSTKLSPLQPQKLDGIESPSSSGSETTPPKSPQRMSRFCHECGSKYPLSCAKFCVECGVKRLVL